MDKKTLINDNPAIQSDGLAINQPQSKIQDVEPTQYYVVKNGISEASPKFTTPQAAQSALAKLLLENAGALLRIAIVDVNGRELLRG